MMGFVICRIMNTYIDRYMRGWGGRLLGLFRGSFQLVCLWNIYFSLSGHKCIDMKCIYCKLFASYFVYFKLLIIKIVAVVSI